MLTETKRQQHQKTRMSQLMILSTLQSHRPPTKDVLWLSEKLIARWKYWDLYTTQTTHERCSFVMKIEARRVGFNWKENTEAMCTRVSSSLFAWRARKRHVNSRGFLVLCTIWRLNKGRYRRMDSRTNHEKENIWVIKIKQGQCLNQGLQKTDKFNKAYIKRVCTYI